jgi:hypothetical protein
MKKQIEDSLAQEMLKELIFLYEECDLGSTINERLDRIIKKVEKYGN